MTTWNERLKKARKDKDLTMDQLIKNLGPIDMVTKPTLISYEQGKIFPKMNVLKRMCEIYGVSADYIIFGENKDFIPTVPDSDTLLCIYMMVYNKKAKYEDGKLEILDEKLKLKIKRALGTLGYFDFSSFNQLQTFATGLESIAKEED